MAIMSNGGSHNQVGDDDVNQAGVPPLGGGAWEVFSES